MEENDLKGELVEWLSQKKSEWLAEIIAQQPQDDLNFDQLHHYELELEGIEKDFDESFEWQSDKINLKTFLKFMSGKRLTVLVVIAIEHDSVTIPVFYFATYYRSVADLFCRGKYFSPPKH